MKNNTKQLTQQVGEVNIGVNICKQDANLHISVPLISTVGLSPIDTGLVFNLQDRTEYGMFGYGCRLDKYMYVQSISGGYSVTNADGSIDKYLTSNGLYNKQTELTLSRVSSGTYDTTHYYTLTDKYNNVIKLNESDEYPKSIITKSGYEYTYDFISATKTIDNNHGDVVTLLRNNSTLINRVEYKHNGTLMGYTVLDYTDNYLTKITYYNQSTVIGELTFTLNGDTVIVKDEISGYRIKYTLSDNKVISFIDGYNDNFTNGQTTSLSYEDNKTTITDYRGKKAYVFFDNNGIPLYEIDEEGYLIKTRYDNESGKVLSVSSTIATIDNKLPNIFSSNDISSFELRTVNIEKTECTDEFLSKILSDSTYKAIGTTKYSFLYKNEPIAGVATDNITAVVWVKQLTPSTDDNFMKISLSAGENEGESILLDKKTIDNQFDVYVLGLTAEKSYDYIRLWIDVRNASIEVGGIQILKKGFGSFYTYDENGNLTHTLSDSGTTDTEYDSNNNPTTSIDKDSSKTQTTINKNRLVKTLSAYGVTTDYTYDGTYKNNLLSTKITNDDGDKIMETKQEYTSDGRFISKSIDALGNPTSYTYDTYGNIKTVMNALSVVTTYNYNDDETVSSITRSLNGSEQKAEYTYDTKKRLSTVTLSNGTVYELGYDGKYLYSINVNGKSLIKYMYNKVNGTVRQMNYGQNGDKYLFTYNGDSQIIKIRCLNSNSKEVNSYTYSYNSKKQLEEICRNGNVLCHYSYDDEGNVIEAYNSTFDIKYTYDNLGNVAIKSTKVNGKTINTSYDSVSRSKGSQPDSLITAFSNKPCKIITFDDLSSTKSLRAGKDGIISYGDTSNKTLKFNLPNNVTPGESACLQFWFKAKSYTASSASRFLFSIKTSSGSSFIGAYLVNKKVTLALRDKNGINKTLIEIDNSIDLKNWNFVSLSYMYRDDGQGYKAVAEYALTINGTTKIFSYDEDDIQYVEETERTIVSLMLFNYMLLKFDSPTMQLLYQDLKKYRKACDKYYEGDEIPVFNLFYGLIPKAKYQEKSYYKKLRPLTINEIYNRLNQDRAMLENSFSIKGITIFGSFAKGIERIDSDIDLLISFSHDLTHAQKQANIDYLSKYYFNVFNRYIDFNEISDYLDDELIKSTAVMRKIF